MKESTKQLLKAVGYKQAVSNINLGLCALCERIINKKEFKGSKSYKEFQISGLCQKCQDEIFKPEEEF